MDATESQGQEKRDGALLTLASSVILLKLPRPQVTTGITGPASPAGSGGITWPPFLGGLEMAGKENKETTRDEDGKR